jgi:hypothetical protein
LFSLQSETQENLSVNGQTDQKISQKLEEVECASNDKNGRFISGIIQGNEHDSKRHSINIELKLRIQKSMVEK